MITYLTSDDHPLLFTGGGVTIVFETCGGHFIEFLKIAKQTTTTESYFQIIRKVTQSKGLAGTLDGFVPWGCLQAVAKGSVFSYGQAQSIAWTQNVSGLSKETKTVISGGVGGFIQGLAMSPLLLLKTRVMTDPVFRTSGGLLETAVASAKVGGRIVASEGPLALFKGVGIFSTKRALDWTTRYLFVVMVEEQLKVYNGSKKLSDGQVVFAALLGGSLSALSTIPMDVMVANKQSAHGAHKHGPAIDPNASLLVKIQGSTRGLVARIIHVALTTLMMKTMTSVVYDILFPLPTDAAKH